MEYFGDVTESETSKGADERMTDQKIILFDSPEAVESAVVNWPDGTTTTIYKYMLGTQVNYTPDEALARWAGCTHRQCPETGEVFEKNHSHGPTVRERIRAERYASLTQSETAPDGSTRLFYERELFYDDVQELLNAFGGPGPIGEILWAESVYAEDFDVYEHYGDISFGIDHTVEPSVEVVACANKLNRLMQADGPICYTESNTRPTDAQLAEWNQLIAERYGKA